jgi:hypothetical protein
MKRRRLFLEKGIACIAAAGWLITFVNHIFALAGQSAFLSPTVTLTGAILVAALALPASDTRDPRAARAFDQLRRPAQIVLGALILYGLTLGMVVLTTEKDQVLMVPRIGQVQSRAVGVLCFQPFTLITFLLSAVFSWFKTDWSNP